MIVKTHISAGYTELIETFFKANDLLVTCTSRYQASSGNLMLNLEFENNSDTSMSITLMSVRHLGFENMLVDYLKRCGIPLSIISTGSSTAARDMKELEKGWQEYRIQLGFR